MGKDNERDLSSDDLYNEMEALEPSTAGGLASKDDAPKQRVRDLLEGLSERARGRIEEPEPKHARLNREAPIHECGVCGYKYEVRLLYPGLSSVQFRPRCGT